VAGEAEMGGWGAIGDPVNKYIYVVLVGLAPQTQHQAPQIET